MQTDHETNNDDSLAGFASMLDQVQVHLDTGREEIRPCRSFPKGQRFWQTKTGSLPLRSN
jgi:hypothetical protein